MPKNNQEISLMLLDKFEQLLLENKVMLVLLQEWGIRNIDAYLENARSTPQLLDSVRRGTAELRAHIVSQSELDDKVLEALKALPESASKIVH
jgi:hypothetical protein